MKILIYANCQAAGLRAFIPLVADAKCNIEFFSLENFSAIRTNLDLSLVEKELRQTDVLLYQPVGAGHGAYATVGEKSILARTKSDCIHVSFPYMYNNAFWPCFLEGDEVINGSAIDSFLSAGASSADIQALYDKGQLRFDLLRRFNMSLDILRERERDLDVKIAPIVEREYRKRRLFLTQNHPTDFLFEEVSRQVVRHIFPSGVIDPLDHLTKDENRARLPGRYPFDQCSINELDLSFQRQPDEGASEFYHDNLMKYTESWLKRRAENRL